MLYCTAPWLICSSTALRYLLGSMMQRTILKKPGGWKFTKKLISLWPFVFCQSCSDRLPSLKLPLPLWICTCVLGRHFLLVITSKEFFISCLSDLLLRLFLLKTSSINFNYWDLCEHTQQALRLAELRYNRALLQDSSTGLLPHRTVT